MDMTEQTMRDWKPEKKFDIWLYGRDVGWWLQEEGYNTPEYAAQALGKWIREYDQKVFGAILPSSEPIDLPCEKSSGMTGWQDETIHPCGVGNICSVCKKDTTIYSKCSGAK